MKKKIIKLFLALVSANAVGTSVADDHHHFAKDVDTFHAVLAPIWHARLGPERLPNACAKSDELARLAGGIRSTDASKLVASIATMKAACESKQGGVDGAFYDVHEAFHNLIEAKPAPARR